MPSLSLLACPIAYPQRTKREFFHELMKKRISLSLCFLLLPCQSRQGNLPDACNTRTFSVQKFKYWKLKWCAGHFLHPLQSSFVALYIAAGPPISGSIRGKCIFPK